MGGFVFFGAHFFGRLRVGALGGNLGGNLGGDLGVNLGGLGRNLGFFSLNASCAFRFQSNRRQILVISA